MNDEQKTIFNKATLVLSQASYVDNKVELPGTSQEQLSLICSKIETAAVNAGLPCSSRFTSVSDNHTISVKIPASQIVNVLKTLHKLDKEPTHQEKMQRENAANLMSYIEKLKTSEQAKTAPVSMEKTTKAHISISPDFIGPMPVDSEKESKEIAVAA